MDKNAIKKYAVWARKELIARVSQRAMQFGISDDRIYDKNADSVNGILLSSAQKSQRAALINKIEQYGGDKKAYEQVIEEVAYTWFNRFTALRFMEVNGFLPARIRVFTDASNHFKPQILAEALYIDMPEIKKDVVIKLKQENKEDELFKYLLIAQCNSLQKELPMIFEKISDYTELLFPDNLLREESVVGKLISDIAEEDWNVGESGQVEIIGWLYQYYISEKHEEVVDPLHGKVVNKEDVPAATQLFTTEWVVRYITDNSVGRYWIERNPNSALAGELEYFIAPDSDADYKKEYIEPKQLTVFDPCVGSGHFLVYAFDVLMKIYLECGYNKKDAARSIVENNLFGLDIDKRATQMACFAVMMKACSYDSRFLMRHARNNIFSIEESDNIDEELISYFCNGDADLTRDLTSVLNEMKGAKEYGSIIQITPINFDAFYKRFDEIEDNFTIYSKPIKTQLLPIVKVAELLAKKYSAVITNPPYLNKFSAKLKAYIEANYAEYKGDLFSVFMYRNFGFCERGGYSGFMTPNVWMFIATYEKLRRYIINNKSIVTLVQMAKGAFFKEATVDVCAFVTKNEQANLKGSYIRLEDFKGDMELQGSKTRQAIKDRNCGYFYTYSQFDFVKIPGSPIAYWVSENIIKAFDKGVQLNKLGSPRQGVATADNNHYLREWYEVNNANIQFNIASHTEAKTSTKKWYPYNKGGEFRKWYGNAEFVVNWLSDGQELRHDKKAVLRNPGYYFRECISWSKISSGSIAFRYYPQGFIFDVAGCCIFYDNQEQMYYNIGMLNSKITKLILEIISPTLNYEVGHIATLPIIESDENSLNIRKLVNKNISLSKDDWDSFEISWDFKKHPLVPLAREMQEQKNSQFADARMKKFGLISTHYKLWEEACQVRFNELKQNEEELNRIFIDIYGLQEELTPKVEDKDVTVRLADLQRDVKSLISYAVGCIFGRYSLDCPGLAYAGGEWDEGKYVTYIPDKDNIIPVYEEEYSDDDIVGKFIQFIKVAYGKDTLEENLAFIAAALGGKGTARDIIRDYFNNGFYADHVKMYHKRPIYWLFSSGKKGGFKALVYMHRYKPDTIARIRTDYVHMQQTRYNTNLEYLDREIKGASTSESIKLNKLKANIIAKADELFDYEQKIHHLADRMIDIDLDDGVVSNYALFQDILAKIK